MTLLDRIDEAVFSHIREHHVPGISVALVEDGISARGKGYGFANVELAVPATEDSVYQLASITKTFTATAIMMLTDEGRLSLDDAIPMPNMPSAWREVTLRHLLNHTSGIKSVTSVETHVKTRRSDTTPRELIELVIDAPMDFAPGEAYRYNNTGYVLLGMLIEEVSGQSYGEFLEDRIFEPLGMSQTRVNDLRVVIPNRVTGYEWNGTELRNGEYVSPSQPFAAGALASTVSDLAKWAPERLVSEASLEQMWTPAVLNNGETANYGLGWEINEFEGRRLVAHNGGIPGFATRFSRFPDDGLTVVVLTNEENNHVRGLAETIASLVLNA